MHVRTEDLLTIRDGEPIDAALRERIVADPENLREIRRLQRVGNALRALPDRTPPADGWARVAAAARPASRRRGRGRAAGAAAAIAVAAVAAWLSLRSFEVPSVVPGVPPSQVSVRGSSADLPEAVTPDAARASPGTSSSAASTGLAALPPYAPLLEESARLERLLTRLEVGPRRMNAATAITIADLEDRVAVLDEQLSFAAARGIDARQRRALWRERVDVMNALVQVRYAHLQPVGR